MPCQPLGSTPTSTTTREQFSGALQHSLGAEPCNCHLASLHLARRGCRQGGVPSCCSCPGCQGKAAKLQARLGLQHCLLHAGGEAGCGPLEQGAKWAGA